MDTATTRRRRQRRSLRQRAAYWWHGCRQLLPPMENNDSQGGNNNNGSTTTRIFNNSENGTATTRNNIDDGRPNLLQRRQQQRLTALNNNNNDQPAPAARVRNDNTNNNNSDDTNNDENAAAEPRNGPSLVDLLKQCSQPSQNSELAPICRCWNYCGSDSNDNINGTDAIITCQTIVSRIQAHPRDLEDLWGEHGWSIYHWLAAHGQRVCHHILQNTQTKYSSDNNSIHGGRRNLFAVVSPSWVWTVDALGRTPLHVFILYSQPRCGDNDDDNAFFDDELLMERLRFFSGCFEDGHLVQLLLQQQRYNPASLCDINGNLPLHLAVQRSHCFSPRALEFIRKLHPQAIFERNDDQRNPLTIYCEQEQCRLDVVESLLDVSNLDGSRLSILTASDQRPNTPLGNAIRHGHGAIARWLLQQPQQYQAQRALDNNNDINDNINWTALYTHRNHCGENLLHHCCAHLPDGDDQENCRIWSSLVEEILLVMPRLASERIAWNDYTPLHVLCRQRLPKSSTAATEMQVRMAHLLITMGPAASISLVDNEQGYTALHHAVVFSDNVELVELLIRADPNGVGTPTTLSRDTPLSLAAARSIRFGRSSNVNSDSHSKEDQGHRITLAIVELLCEACPEAAKQPNRFGFLPLHAACRAAQSTSSSTSMVRLLMEVYPQALTQASLAGELPIDLCRHQDALVELLSNASEYPSCQANDNGGSVEKMHQTPLHQACHKEVDSRNIQELAMNNPTWVTARNAGGHSCLQLLCRSGRLDSETLDLFVRIAGVEALFETNNDDDDDDYILCLHSAISPKTEASAIVYLMNAFPAALESLSDYADTPLHLACSRGVDVEVVRQLLVTGGWPAQLLSPNKSGRTPASIVADDFHQNLRCKGEFDVGSSSMERAYQLLVLFALVLYHDTVRPPPNANIVHACITMHRRNVRVHPAFLRQVIRRNPRDLLEVDKASNGLLPIHVEASISIEKMVILNGGGDDRKICSVHGSDCQDRESIIRELLDINPAAVRHVTADGSFLLKLLLDSGRSWDVNTAKVAQLHPPALSQLGFIPIERLVVLVGKECGPATVFQLLRAQPGLLLHR